MSVLQKLSDPTTPVPTGHSFAAGVSIHRGMPPLPPEPLYPAFRRHLSDRVFYLIPAAMWAAFSLRHLSVTLPTAANPKMEAGGLWGERKSQDLSLFGKRAAKYVAPYVAMKLADADADAHLQIALRLLDAAELEFPLVAKPDRGYQGWGVRKLETPKELREYLSSLLPGTGLLLQKFVSHEGEAGIFYVRRPGESRGRILSMALTYAPHVVGDGSSTLQRLIEADRVLHYNREIYRSRHHDRWDHVLEPGEVVILTDARSARLGAVYRDARHLVTRPLQTAIERIAQDIPDFHFGRFDVRFRSVEDLQNGESLSILELNGAGAEMLHIWDGRTRLYEAYRTLWTQYRTLFSIGGDMRRRGCRPAGIGAMIALQRRQEHLRRGYPPSA